jgi:hypothetical protein
MRQRLAWMIVVSNRSFFLASPARIRTIRIILHVTNMGTTTAIAPVLSVSRAARSARTTVLSTAIGSIAVAATAVAILGAFVPSINISVQQCRDSSNEEPCRAQMRQ